MVDVPETPKAKFEELMRELRQWRSLTMLLPHAFEECNEPPWTQVEDHIKKLKARLRELGEDTDGLGPYPGQMTVNKSVYDQMQRIDFFARKVYERLDLGHKSAETGRVPEPISKELWENFGKALFDGEAQVFVGIDWSTDHVDHLHRIETAAKQAHVVWTNLRDKPVLEERLSAVMAELGKALEGVKLPCGCAGECKGHQPGASGEVYKGELPLDDPRRKRVYVDGMVRAYRIIGEEVHRVQTKGVNEQELCATCHYRPPVPNASQCEHCRDEMRKRGVHFPDKFEAWSPYTDCHAMLCESCNKLMHLPERPAYCPNCGAEGRVKHVTDEMEEKLKKEPSSTSTSMDDLENSDFQLPQGLSSQRVEHQAGVCPVCGGHSGLHDKECRSQSPQEQDSAHGAPRPQKSAAYQEGQRVGREVNKRGFAAVADEMLKEPSSQKPETPMAGVEFEPPGEWEKNAPSPQKPEHKLIQKALNVNRALKEQAAPCEDPLRSSLRQLRQAAEEYEAERKKRELLAGPPTILEQAMEEDMWKHLEKARKLLEDGVDPHSYTILLCDGLRASSGAEQELKNMAEKLRLMLQPKDAVEEIHGFHRAVAAHKCAMGKHEPKFEYDEMKGKWRMLACKHCRCVYVEET